MRDGLSHSVSLLNEHVVQGVWAHTLDPSDLHGFCPSLKHSDCVKLHVCHVSFLEFLTPSG